MARVFLSYSSRDREVVHRLATDLKDLGHEPWLDEWEIRVGESIPSKIGRGIAEADFVIIVLSSNSTTSSWVQKEWSAKYLEEVDSKEVRVLPALIEDCQIPELLREKRYADFRNNYSLGLAALNHALALKDKTEMPSAPEPLTLSKFSHILHSVLEEIEERPGSLIVGQPTGFADFDRTTNGLQKGSLTVIAGRSGVGKTALALDIARNLAIRERKEICFFSQGLAQSECSIRVLCAEAGVPVESLRAARLSSKQWAIIYQTTKAIGEAPIFLDDRLITDISHFSSHIRRLKEENSLCLIIVDDFNQSVAMYGNRIALVTWRAHIKRLKELAKDVDIPIVVTVTLPISLAGDDGKDAEVTEDDSAYHLKAETDVFVVLRDEASDPGSGPGRLSIKRLEFKHNRFGAPGRMSLVFNHDLLAFSNMIGESAPALSGLSGEEEWDAADIVPPPRSWYPSGFSRPAAPRSEETRATQAKRTDAKGSESKQRRLFES